LDEAQKKALREKLLKEDRLSKETIDMIKKEIHILHEVGRCGSLFIGDYSTTFTVSTEALSHLKDVIDKSPNSKKWYDLRCLSGNERLETLITSSDSNCIHLIGGKFSLFYLNYIRYLGMNSQITKGYKLTENANTILTASISKSNRKWVCVLFIYDEDGKGRNSIITNFYSVRWYIEKGRPTIEANNLLDAEYDEGSRLYSLVNYARDYIRDAVKEKSFLDKIFLLDKKDPRQDLLEIIKGKKPIKINPSSVFLLSG